MNQVNKTLVGGLSTWYAEHPAIKALLSLVPGWGAAHELIQTRANEITQARARIFFDELGAGKIALSKTLIESNDFLHCYFKTLQAAVQSRHKEKIEMFARMLQGAMEPPKAIDLDQYEELLDTLDEMSLREVNALHMLRRHERASETTVWGNDLDRITSYWSDFQAEACRKLGLEESEFEPFMERLVRTGLYKRNTDSFYGDGPKMGATTRQFEKLLWLIQEKTAAT